MADELIMKALEEAYKLVLFHRNQRAAGLRLVAQADEEIAKVTPKIIGLAALVDVPEDSELGQFVLEMASMGITDAVRLVLRSAGPAIRIKPTSIRDRLIKMGVKLDYNNPLAVIGSTLKRLEEAGEVRKTMSQGTAMYSWIRIPDPPPLEEPSIDEVLKRFQKPERNAFKELAQKQSDKK